LGRAVGEACSGWERDEGEESRDKKGIGGKEKEIRKRK